MNSRFCLLSRATPLPQLVFLSCLATVSLARATPVPRGPGKSTAPDASPRPPSQAVRALERGDFHAALHSASPDETERQWIQARIHLARFEWDQAGAAVQNLAADSEHRAELAWLLAHGRRDPVAIAAAAADYCQQGDPTGRACADAEFYENRVVNANLALAQPASLPLIEDAPFPMLRAEMGRHIRGVVVDTGASQSVVSAKTAAELGLATTQRSFPIAVAGGEGIAQARLAVLPLVNFGPMQLWTLPVLVVDMPALDAMGIGLILSPQQAFDGHEVVFDFPSAQLRVGTADARSEIADEINMPYFAAGFDLVVRASLDQGPEAMFGLDTGMEGPYVVSSRYWDRLQGARRAEPHAVSSAVLYGAGGDARVEPVRAETIRMGTTLVQPAEDGVRSEMSRHGPFDIAGLLGNGLWRDRVVVLDTQKHRLRLGAAAIP